MAPPRKRAANRSWHREHLTALVQRPPRGDQRSAAVVRLDHQRSERQTTDDTIAPRKVLPLWSCPWWKFRDERASRPDATRQAGVLSRVHTIESRAQYGYRAAPGGKRALMAGRVDAGRQTTGDDQPGPSQAAGHIPGNRAAQRRCLARPDHRKLRRRQYRNLAEHIERRGRSWDRRKLRRIIILAPQQQASTARAQPFEIGAERRLFRSLQKLARRGREIDVRDDFRLTEPFQVPCRLRCQSPNVLPGKPGAAGQLRGNRGDTHDSGA